MIVPLTRFRPLWMFLGILLLPWVIEGLLGRGWVRILDFALLSVLLAVGLNIVVGYAGLLDLGFIAFFGVGAYAYALLASPQFGLHWPLWAILPTGVLVAASFGVALGWPTLGLRGDYLAIVTMGFGEIIRVFLNNLTAPVNITNGPQGITMIDALHLGTWSFARPHRVLGIPLPALVGTYYLFLLFVLLALFLSRRLEYSRIGRAWMAIREDEIAAASMGLDTRRLKLLAYALGAVFGGVAGGLFAGFQGFVSPESFTLQESVMILCMVVLGGMGNLRGVVAGALLLAFLPEVLRPLGGWQQHWFHRVLIDPSTLRLLLFGVTLVVLMRWRPEGLFPSRARAREWHTS
ncbi:high-affinity branched-chain amino acid ABC transporter permease LivM [Ferrovum sp.]|uniref:branched-chain amino acid ABC transporter permease n=1 Tax=Ferrovum sp. TaxID=2609467 RepID=UPI0026159A7E|nr:high-affinity branched-chain amino acid ABC transporter permease LivM [Ferrovum sp.]